MFAGYTILRVLGSGGMGAVYLASHPRLPREDALKVLPADLTVDPEFRTRFLREADLAATLSHPHIVGIYDRGEDDGRFWISMDYIAGTDAGRLLSEHYPRGMPLEHVAAIATAVGSALDYAHHRGLLHRDVKPANILLTEPDGQPRRVFLADFGLARRIDDVSGLTATNMTVGTVAYVAPEQLRGAPADGRADQYALAATMFHLLAGAPPYDSPIPSVVIRDHVSAPPPSISAHRPDLAALDHVFARALAKNPSERFGSCGEFAQHLEQSRSAGRPVPRHPTGDRGGADAVPANPSPDRRPGGHCVAPCRRWCRCRHQAHPAPQSGRECSAENRSPADQYRQPGTQHGSLHGHLPRHLRSGLQSRRCPGPGRGSVDEHVRRALGVRVQRVRGDGVTPQRRIQAGVDGGLRPGRWSLGGRNRRHRPVPGRPIGNLADVHPGLSSRRHADRRIPRGGGQCLCV